MPHLFQYTLTRTGDVIHILQDTNQVDGLGGEIWPGAYILCNYLEDHSDTLVVNRSVLELGAGCGLCGLVAAHLGAHRVILTDEYPELLRDNILRNHQLKSIITSNRLCWGENIDETAYQSVDIILGSEITQVGKSLHPSLLRTIRDIMKSSSSPNPLALLSMDLCLELCKGKCTSGCVVTHFVNQAETMGFSITLVYHTKLSNHPKLIELTDSSGKKRPIDTNDYAGVFQLQYCANEK